MTLVVVDLGCVDLLFTIPQAPKFGLGRWEFGGAGRQMGNMSKSTQPQVRDYHCHPVHDVQVRSYGKLNASVFIFQPN